MRWNPQGGYAAGSVIEAEVLLTAHHKGHFEFKACPVSSNNNNATNAAAAAAPTQECFDEHPLTFVSDELYGAPPDANHPERAYVAPDAVANRVASSRPGFEGGMVFRYRLRLPEGMLAGNAGGGGGGSALLQWYYVASNSACVHPGYDEYDWPLDWLASSSGGGGGGGEEHEGDGDSTSSSGGGIAASVWEQKASVGTGLKMCDEVLPADGNGLPEQFWNCAEITITEEEEEAPRPDEEASLLLSDRQNNARGHDKTIIGYYASWQWYDRQKLAEPSNMDFTKVTRVNFAFFQTDVRGNLWGTDSWADPNLLFGPYNWNPTPDDPEYCSWDAPHAKTCKSHFYEEGLIHAAHAAGAEVWPSLGGWSLSDPFPEMAADAAARMHFAEGCVELIEDYGFDGLDIDWEYPGYEDHSGTPADTENYNLLLRDLRLKLDELGERTGKFYGLTAALPCGTNNINNIDIPTVAKYLTEFNLMTYDFFGAWSPTSGANAPLYDQDWGDDDVNGFSVDGCTRNWINGGAPPSAINIGLPFYGRSFLKAKGLNEPHEGNDKNTWFWDDGSPQYFNIVDKLSDLVSVRHEPTKTQYAYKDSTTGGLVSYDDEEAICDKTEYCLSYNLNGFIIWELSGDLMPDLSTPLLDTLNDKLTNPSLDCKTLQYDPEKISEESGVSTISNTQQYHPLPNQPLPAPSTNTQQYHPLPNPILNQPLSAPSTMAPTHHLYCPEGATGTRQYDGCIGYYYCLYGIAKYPFIPCSQGTMFDENLKLCLPEDTVTPCSATSSPTSSASTRIPTYYPTNFPTEPPITLSPVITTFILLGGNRPNKAPTSTSSSIATAPVDVATSPTTTQQYPVAPQDNASLSRPTSSIQAGPASAESIATVKESSDASSLRISCPTDYTGILPWNDCREYFYCIYAIPHVPTISCEEGKRFDVDSNMCKYASQVSCESSYTSLETSDVGNKPFTKPKLSGTPDPIRMPTMQPTNPPSISSTEVPTSKAPSTAPPTPKEPTVSPTHLSTQSKPSQSVLDALLAQSYIESNSSPQQPPILDNMAVSTSSIQSLVGHNSNSPLQPSLVGNNSNSPLEPSAPSETAPTRIPGSLPEIHHTVNVVSYFWIGSSYSSSDPTDLGGAPNDSPLPEDFALNRPFITIELMLSDSPGDVGWQLISLDGSVNVAKPTGAYSAMEPNSVVYEGISLKMGLDPSDGILELKWTIVNVKGEGQGPAFKIFGDFPLEANLLAVGDSDSFDYMESVGLGVTNKGLITVMKDDPLDEMVSYSVPLFQNQGTGNDDTGGMVAAPENNNLDLNSQTAGSPQNNSPDLNSQTAGSVDQDQHHYQMQLNEKETPILIPALISFVAIAILAGLVFLVFAYRRKPLTAQYDNDEETNFEEGSWDDDGDRMPEEEFYENYYSTADEEQHNSCMTITEGVSNTDPPDSFDDDQERHLNSADFATSEPPTGEAFYASYTESSTGEELCASYINDAEEEQDDQEEENSSEGNSTDNSISEFNDSSDSSTIARVNQAYSSADIDELLEATRADLEQDFAADIYSILERLEEEGGCSEEDVFTDDSLGSASVRSRLC